MSRDMYTVIYLQQCCVHAFENRGDNGHYSPPGERCACNGEENGRTEFEFAGLDCDVNEP